MRNRMWRAGGSAGFTLVELVVVMTIIAILVSAAVLYVPGKVQQGRRTRALQDIKVFEEAVDLYQADNGDPPTTQQGLQALRTKPTTDPIPQNWTGPYVKKSIPLDPWGHEYVYRSPGQMNPDGYDIISYGKDGAPGGTGQWDMDVTNAP